MADEIKREPQQPEESAAAAEPPEAAQEQPEVTIDMAALAEGLKAKLEAAESRPPR